MRDSIASNEATKDTYLSVEAALDMIGKERKVVSPQARFPVYHPGGL